jgi:homoserine kinase
LGNTTEAYTLPWPATWNAAVWIPEDALLTEAARQVLPSDYPLTVVVNALRSSALFTHAIHTVDATLLTSIVEGDLIHEPYRGGIIQGFEEFRQTMKAVDGVLGSVISGSGSTCLSLFESQYTSSVKTHMQEWVDQWGGQYRLLPVEPQGAFFFNLPSDA